MNTLQIGKSIKKRRKSLGITQAELALLASCSKPTVIAIERGKPTLRLDKLIAILKVLGLELQITDPQEAKPVD